nr:hypothetical protein [Tanacetum cinerariifolium]
LNLLLISGINVSLTTGYNGRASTKYEGLQKVHNETGISELRMVIMQQSMKMDMWEIKEKLAEIWEQMAIRAYEKDKMREEWIQKIKEHKRREEWNQRIEDVINLIQSFIQNPISLIKTPQPVTTKVPVVTTMVPVKPINNFPCYDDSTSDQNKKTM